MHIEYLIFQIHNGFALTRHLILHCVLRIMGTVLHYLSGFMWSMPSACKLAVNCTSYELLIIDMMVGALSDCHLCESPQPCGLGCAIGRVVLKCPNMMILCCWVIIHVNHFHHCRDTDWSGLGCNYVCSSGGDPSDQIVLQYVLRECIVTCLASLLSVHVHHYHFMAPFM